MIMDPSSLLIFLVQQPGMWLLLVWGLSGLWNLSLDGVGWIVSGSHAPIRKSQTMMLCYLLNVAPLGGVGMVDVLQQRADVVEDDVLLMKTRGPIDRPGTCCARLDDFDWVVPPYVPDLVLPGRDVDVGATDVSPVGCRRCFWW